MASGLLDEGAGPYDSQAFRARARGPRDPAAASMPTATASRASSRRSPRHREHAFELLRLALTEPRFDAEPVERVRSQILAELRRREAEPDYLASRAWFDARLSRPPLRPPDPRHAREHGGHQPRRPAAPSPHRRLGRDRLVVGVAGDITADALAPLLDHDLRRPAGARPAARGAGRDARAPAAPGSCARPIPQSVVTFGHAGLDRARPRLLRRLCRQLHPGRRRLQLAAASRRSARSAASPTRSIPTSTSSTTRPCGWAASPPTTSRWPSRIALIRQELARMAARRARRPGPRQRQDLPHRLLPAAADQQRPGRARPWSPCSTRAWAATISTAATP